MTARHFTYGRLTSFAPLTDLIGGSEAPRVFSKKSMTSSVETCPYIVYKLGNATVINLSEDSDGTYYTQFLQIFVHDFTNEEVADYDQIDAVIKQVKAAFKLQVSPGDGVISCQYLETSQDLNDDTLNTVFKYVRFQLITKEL